MQIKRDISDLDFPINRWVMSAGVLTAFVIAQALSLNFLVNDERAHQAAYQPNTSLISARSDSRLGNRFASTPGDLDRLIHSDPSVTVLLEALQPVSFLGPSETGSAGAVFPQSLTKIFFVPSNFFRFIQGEYKTLNGKSIESAFSAGSNSAIISKGLCEKVFGSGNSCPSRIFLKGRGFNISGVVSFVMKESDENHALYLPLDSVSLVADTKKIFISKFALKDSKEETLNRLKDLIDKQQLKSRKPSSRPNFEPSAISIRPISRTIASEKLIPLGFLLNFCLLLFSGAFILFFSRKMWSNPVWIVWRRSLGRKPKSIAKEAATLFLGPFAAFQIVAMLVSLMTVLIILIRKDSNGVVGIDVLLPFPWALVAFWLALPLGVYFSSFLMARLVRPNFRE